MTIALISHPDCLLHEMTKGHPEQPDRLIVIENALQHSELNKELKRYLAPLATKEQLERVHDNNYIDTIFQYASHKDLIKFDEDTYMNSHTLKAALRAAGANIQAVDLVMSQEVSAAFCNIRPPGHHAERSKAMGFCFFNNIAVGVAHALAHYKLQRVAIVDFDVHHGNGTEDIFKKEPRVLLCSSFQHPYYPNSGHESKESHILNIPLPAGTEGNTLRQKIKEYWLPALRDFKPEMLFFSAGFDAYYKDKMSDFLLTEEDYAWVTHETKQIPDPYTHGRVVSTLEGGYDLNGLGACVLAHLQAINSSQK